MDDIILISNLNDFIFCPVSIYFHGLYGGADVLTFQTKSHVFKETLCVAEEDGFHLILGEALFPQGIGQQGHFGAVAQFQLAANAVKVTAQTDDLNAAHLLEMGGVFGHQGRGAVAQVGAGLVIQKSRAVVQAHQTAFFRHDPDHLIGQVAGVGCQRTAVGVAGRKGPGAVLHDS